MNFFDRPPHKEAEKATKYKYVDMAKGHTFTAQKISIRDRNKNQMSCGKE